jgi:cytochrome c553
MRAALLLPLFLVSPARAQESCAACHGEFALLERETIHARAGIDCVACHGGSPGVFELPAAHAGLSPLPAGPRAGVELCSGCHADPGRMHGFGLRTDQKLLYDTSAHGMRLAESDDPAVATCISCHGAHGVRPTSDPRSPVHPQRQPETCGRCHADQALMARYELPADTLELFRGSVHGRALLERGSLASPACADCHGAHGATPPRVDEVGRVCGSCHRPALEQFERGQHLAAARQGLLKECVSCHGSHAVTPPGLQMLTGGEPGHCGSCHQRDPEVLALGAGLHAALSGFDRDMQAAEQALAEAARRGSPVEHARELLVEARALRRAAAPVVHALSPGALDDLLEPGRGLLASALERVELERRAQRDRRILVLVFVGVVLLLAGVLLVHAREVAGRAFGPGSSYAPSRGEGP